MPYKGDPAKQPEECKINERPSGGCPHLKCTQHWDSESYRCERCGESYTLYYEDMA